MEFEEGDVVLCTVDKIEGTVVFVNIEENGEGSIVTSEIAPGRIRNLRDYVIPKKKIVCKILKIDSNKNIHLSLRRVTQKEKKEVLEWHNKEKKAENILKSNLEGNIQEIIAKIKKETSIAHLFEEAKENPQKLEKFISKQEADIIIDILKKEKIKKAVLKKEFSLRTNEPDGLKKIKEILSFKNVEIKYVSAGKYSIKSEDNNIKVADTRIQEVLKEIEQKAKKNKVEFSIKGK